MSERRDTLHLNGVHLIQRVVKNTGGVDDLPSKVLIVEVTHKKRLCGESVRLHIDVGSGDFVHEAGLADVGIATAKKRSGGRVDGWQTAHVLSDLLEVSQWVFLSLDDGSHATQGGLFELLASVQRIAELE